MSNNFSKKILFIILSFIISLCLIAAIILFHKYKNNDIELQSPSNLESKPENIIKLEKDNEDKKEEINEEKKEDQTNFAYKTKKQRRD